MICTYKYRLYPSKKQAQTIDETLNRHRWLYNEALAQRKDGWEQEKKSVSYVTQAKWLTQHRKENETYQNLNVSSCQRTLRRLDKAFCAFFRRVKTGETPGYPRFKGYNRFDSVEFTYSDGIRLRGKKMSAKPKDDGITRSAGFASLLIFSALCPVHRRNQGQVASPD